MFKLVPLKVLKIVEPFQKKMCFFKSFLPPDLLADFQKLLSLAFFHICAVENASENINAFSFTSYGLRATKKPGSAEKMMKPEPKLSLGDIFRLA